MTTSDHTLLIGSYGKADSCHLYHCVLDGQTGQFREVKTWTRAKNSSYLAQSADGKVLSLIKTDQGAGLALFSQQGQLLSQALDQPVPPCHLTYLDKEALALTANYHTGQVNAYQLTPENSLNLIHQVNLEPDSQPHFAGQTTDRFFLVSLMGQDRLVAYDKSWKEIAHYQFPAGTRPRHLVFHCSKKIIYVLGEGDNQVHTLFYDGYGAVEVYQSLSTLPPGAQGESWAGAIRKSPDGRFLYVSNRGHDSLTCFAIAADGSLSWVSNHQLGASNPRDLVLTPEGDWLLVACLDSNQVLSFAIDPQTGTLKASDHIEVEEPVALLVQNP